MYDLNDNLAFRFLPVRQRKFKSFKPAGLVPKFLVQAVPLWRIARFVPAAPDNAGS
jgi:hypothetical protein